MKVFLIDAYDSFVFIIDNYLKTIGLETKVVRNDTPNLIEKIEKYDPDFIVLGPGPGTPEDSGYVSIIKHFEKKLPIMGVCLGHQAIGLAYGGTVNCAKHIMHGKVSKISNDGKGVYFHTGGQDLFATRYHSLIINENNFPESLTITSKSLDDSYIMGVRHKNYPIEGVQFHPESILTENGIELFKSFIKSHVRNKL